MKYKNMKLSEEMQKALELAGYENATEIQEKAIPLAIEGKDILGQAQTGTGKTAAFAIPIIENTDISNKDIQHLILAPTRELATQIMNEFKTLGITKKINVIQIIGGISYERQRERLRTKPHIIVGTPGRIKDYLENGNLKIHNLKSFTLDEVDQLLSIGFQKDIEYINSKLPKNKQMFFFSATFGEKVKRLSKNMLDNPQDIKISSGLSSVDTVKQEYIVVKENKKYEILKLFLQIHKPKGAIIFCRTRRGVENLVIDLKKDGFKIDGIQGDMEQRVRSKVIAAFRNGAFNIVAGTDVLARGIDVGHADYVYNYDLPEEIESYTHRIGRVGRAGREGIALAFVKPSQAGYMKKILRETNSKKAKEINLPEQSELDKIFDSQRTEILNEYLSRKNKHQHEEMILENYSPDEMAKIISVLLKKKVKTFKIDQLLKESNEKRYSYKNKSKNDSNRKRNPIRKKTFKRERRKNYKNK
ncbi:MAG: DEAD/DEAH box helicase [Mycoplasmatales bacterium]|nr:DEAD/DEAH box helicase [Mycoplasmatales bacterium]